MGSPSPPLLTGASVEAAERCRCALCGRLLVAGADDPGSRGRALCAGCASGSRALAPDPAPQLALQGGSCTQPSAQGAGARSSAEPLAARLIVAGASAALALLCAFVPMLAASGSSRTVELSRWLELVFALPAVAWSALPFYREAWTRLGARRVGPELAASGAILVGFGAGLGATLLGDKPGHYGAVALFVAALLAARALEARVQEQLRRARAAAAPPPAVGRGAARADAGAEAGPGSFEARAAPACALLLVAAAAAAALFGYAIDPARAAGIAAAVLLAAGPYALALAARTAWAAAELGLAREGVHLHRPGALERAARVTHVVFDKSGTLSCGRPNLIGVLPARELNAAHCLALAAALERASAHAVAGAVVAAAAERAPAPAALERCRSVPGEGVEGELEGVRYRVGSLEFAGALHGGAPPPQLAFVVDEVGVAALADERGWLALLTFGDALRADARRTVRELKRLGFEVCLLTGDRPAHARYLARELGIGTVRAAANPRAKLAYLRALQERGALIAVVAGAAEAGELFGAAGFSIAIGATAASGACADVRLGGGRIEEVAATFEAAVRAARALRQNLGFTAAYGAAVLPLALAGWVTPLAAALAVSVASLGLVLNAMRLARARQAPRLPAAQGLPGAAARVA